MARTKDYLINRVIKAFTNDDSNAPIIFRTALLKATPIRILSGITGVNIFGYSIYNPNAVSCFVRIYNSTASPTVGTTISVSAPILVPAFGQVVLKGTDLLFNITLNAWVAATTGYADTDTGVPTDFLICEITVK